MSQNKSIPSPLPVSCAINARLCLGIRRTFTPHSEVVTNSLEVATFFFKFRHDPGKVDQDEGFSRLNRALIRGERRTGNSYLRGA